jgi:phospholipid/cholesterol/gamma-HCH transport system substrate-binding protein
MRRTAFLLIGMACLGACAKEHENLVHVIAEQAPGLKKSARVRFRGVDVGLVKEVYFTPSGVRIDLVLTRDDVPIRAQDTVRLALVGAFGEQVVDIQPGVQSAPLITRGATLPKARQDTTAR